jgi:hypothetical protein
MNNMPLTILDFDWLLVLGTRMVALPVHTIRGDAANLADFARKKLPHDCDNANQYTPVAL